MWAYWFSYGNHHKTGNGLFNSGINQLMFIFVYVLKTMRHYSSIKGCCYFIFFSTVFNDYALPCAFTVPFYKDLAGCLINVWHMEACCNSHLLWNSSLATLICKNMIQLDHLIYLLLCSTTWSVLMATSVDIDIKDRGQNSNSMQEMHLSAWASVCPKIFFVNT